MKTSAKIIALIGAAVSTQAAFKQMTGGETAVVQRQNQLAETESCLE